MLIIAHRGASHEAPENTLTAARLAWSEQADAIECDIQLTRDGRLAVLHDADTRRVSTRALTVSESTLDELKAIDVGRWKGERYAGERIPTLEELLSLVPSGRRIFIELKSGLEIVGPLAGCLARSALTPSQINLISFDWAAVQAAKRAMPDCEVSWILERDSGTKPFSPGEVIARSRTSEINGLDLDAELPIDADTVGQIHAAGMRCYVWTVDDLEVARRLVVAGVDGITTNRPGWLRAQLKLSSGAR